MRDTISRSGLFQGIIFLANLMKVMGLHVLFRLLSVGRLLECETTYISGAQLAY